MVSDMKRSSLRNLELVQSYLSLGFGPNRTFGSIILKYTERHYWKDHAMFFIATQQISSC